MDLVQLFLGEEHDEVGFIDLPVTVLHPDAFDDIIRELGIEHATLHGILNETVAIVCGPDRIEKFSESEWWDRYPEDSFTEKTGARSIAAFFEEGFFDRVPIEKDRLESLHSPPTPMSHIQAKYIALENECSKFRRMTELNAPPIIMRGSSALIQRIVVELVAARRGESVVSLFRVSDWRQQPPSVEPVHHVPERGYEPAKLRSLYVADVGVVVSYNALTFLIDYSGQVADCFPTFGLRAVGHRYHDIYFVMGGFDDHINPVVYRRETSERRWVPLDADDDLFIAGTLYESELSAVINVAGDFGFWISRDFGGIQRGFTVVSSDGGYVYDQNGIVVDCANAEPILDLRHFEDAFEDAFVSAFANSTNGWRFALPKDGSTVVTDENLRRIGEVMFDQCCFDASGLHLIAGSAHEVCNFSVETMEKVWTIDVQDLESAIPSFESDLLRDLQARFGAPELMETTDLSTVRVEMKDLLTRENWDEISDESLASALQAFAASGALPIKVPFGR